MTLQEIEDRDYELRSFIADKFKDIQMQSNALKNPEDEDKNKTTLIKICDAVEDIRRSYGQLLELSMEIPEEPPAYSEWDDGSESDGFSSGW